MRRHKLTTHRADGRGRRRLRRPNVEALEQRSLLATITVTGDGDTIASDGVVTFREAIEIANGTLDVGSLTPEEQARVSGTLTTGTPGDTIAFDIPGAGVHTIRPTTALPIIRDPVVIDGYTQPGSSPNTLDVGDNAALRIEVQAYL